MQLVSVPLLLFFFFLVFITMLRDLEAAQITPSVSDSKFPPLGHDF